MITVSRNSDLKKRLADIRETGQKIGLVPTMGALHEGHLSLIRTSRKEKMFSVVSVFVNPTQFGPAEDYRKYPRNLKEDARLADKAGADLMFAPQAKEMYPAEYRTFVEVGELSKKLCGKYRPGHFRGVATVVLKLLHLVQPDKVYFGWKDAQQLIIIKKMVEDLNFPTQIVGVPTVREPDGLAMSSRNVYLSQKERGVAPLLYRTLLQIKNDVKCGKSLKNVLEKSRDQIEKTPLVRLQYLEAVDLKTLDSAENKEGKLLVAVAALLGPTRLIDNIMINVKIRRIP